MAPRLIGVGLPRSGTSFLASAVRPPRVGLHEFDAEPQALLVATILNGTAPSETVRRYLAQRLRRSATVDADVSHLNAFMAAEWVELEPDARFVMTVREPIAWIDSFARHTDRLHAVAWHWRLLREARFQPERWPHRAGEELLAQRGLPSLDGFMAYWVSHVSCVLSAVPAPRLMTVTTQQLSDSLSSIAAFLGWSGDLEVAGARYNATGGSVHDAGLCSQLPRALVRQAMLRHLSHVDMRALGLPELGEQLSILRAPAS